jgi:hypothetical protein
VDGKWVPIGSNMIHLCISCEGKTITWLNEEGLFRARKDDIRLRPCESASGRDCSARVRMT